ncbi:meso-butanediol dehydrogenase/(S,S)-butanediol dehydrogenase/diacetyl reductase [Arthrobacter globiformis]|nr:meso-butanediol dehydrogenase/(S,S)-butanediol dehydrogenase/diacetyl reductase [Arthrobacter globiformis]
MNARVSSPTKPLAGKVAVVTEAGQGIGRGIADVLAADGAAVVVTGLQLSHAQESAEAIRARGQQATCFRQDVLDLSSTAEVLARAEEAFGSVDILVNNAGAAHQTPFLPVTERSWDFINDINAKAVFFACQAAGDYFEARGAGKIVNIAPMPGKSPMDEHSAYKALKFSVIGITQSAAIELAKHNVNVNAVCPGIVRTPIWDNSDPQQWDRQVGGIPLGRGHYCEDIGHAVAFLASERAKNITGASLAVNGGFQIW